MSSFFTKDDYTLRWGRAIVAGLVGLLGLVVLIGLIFAFPFKKVPNGYVALSYGGGLVEGQEFQFVKPGPSGMFLNGFADNLFLYPSTLRTYIVSSVSGEGDREGSDAIRALDKNGVEITYEVAVYFKLNLDQLQKFHDSIGLKYHAWCDAGETNCSDGWEHMLNDTLRQQLENALQGATRTHDTDEFRNAQTIRDIQREVELNLKDNVNRVLGNGLETEFFCGPDYVAGGDACPDFSVVIKRPSLPEGVLERYRAVQQSLIQIEEATNKVKVAEQEAQAIRERQEALESCGQTCVLYEAIKAGSIDFWVVPDTGLNLTLPQRSTG